MRFKFQPKVIVATALAVMTLIGSPMAAYAGYAPSDRPTFTCITPTNCPGANYVTFNSFTNAPNYGDERAFFDGKEAGAQSTGNYLDKINVRDGEHVTLRVYIHNNANPGAIGVDAATAKNTALQVLLPKEKKTSSSAYAAVSASNANPGTVSDSVDFAGDRPFTMTFAQDESVMMTYRPNGQGDYVTRVLPGASFASDTVLNANFGDWHGCFEYAALVTMTVVVHMPEIPTPTPAYHCDAFTITADVNRTVKVSTFSTTATNGAVFKNATVNWGDNSADTTATNIVGQTHQYDKNKDATYTITATAHFTVNGAEVSDSGPECVQKVTFQGEKPPVVTPPTTTTTTTTPPTKLVNTGAGSTLAIFAAATAAGAFIYRRMLTRRLSND